MDGLDVGPGGGWMKSILDGTPGESMFGDPETGGGAAVTATATGCWLAWIGWSLCFDSFPGGMLGCWPRHSTDIDICW